MDVIERDAERLELPELVPSRWMEAQRITLGATLLNLTDSPALDEQDRVFSPLWRDSEPPEPNELAGYLARLETLPPACLEALCALPVEACGVWDGHQPLW